MTREDDRQCNMGYKSPEKKETVLYAENTKNDDIKIELLRNQKGAQKYGDCISCGKGSSEDKEMICITFGETRQCAMRICLCRECRDQLKRLL